MLPAPQHIQLCPMCWGACGDPDYDGDICCLRLRQLVKESPQVALDTPWKSARSIMLIDVIDDQAKMRFSSAQPASNLSADGRITKGDHSGRRWERSYKKGKM